MPMGNGTGPQGLGPGTGQRRGKCGAGKDSWPGGGNKSQSLIGIIGSAITLAASFVKLLSHKKQDEKKRP